MVANYGGSTPDYIVASDVLWIGIVEVLNREVGAGLYCLLWIR